MKKAIALLVMASSLSLPAFAGEGPKETVLKSAEFAGTISGKAKNGDKFCMLVVQLIEFTNDIHPDGPIKYQHVDYKLYTGATMADISNKPYSDAETIDRVNEENPLNALPLSEGVQRPSSSKASSYDGRTLIQQEKRGDSFYSGKTQVTISNVSPLVFDSKPSSVSVLMKGGTVLPVNTEADFICEL